MDGRKRIKGLISAQTRVASAGLRREESEIKRGESWECGTEAEGESGRKRSTESVTGGTSSRYCQVMRGEHHINSTY